MTHFEIGSLFSEAYQIACTVQNGVSGFRCCGIWPYRPGIFQDSDFAPTETISSTSAQANTDSVEQDCSQPASDHQRQPSTSSSSAGNLKASALVCDHSGTAEPSTSYFMRASIRPLSKESAKRINRRKHRTKRADILTSTPDKNAAREKATKKKQQRHREKRCGNKLFCTETSRRREANAKNEEVRCPPCDVLFSDPSSL